jgi:hypothetical protein
VPIFSRSKIISLHMTTRLAKRLAQFFSKHSLRRAIHTLWSTLLALSFAAVAHTQGTMDFSGATTLMRELITVKGYSHAEQSFETKEIYRAFSTAVA